MQQYPFQQIGDVREYSRRMVRELGLLQQPHSILGVTPSQCHALIEIDRHGAISSAQLADLLWLDRSTTSRVVSSLFRAGYVEEAPGHDRRSKPLRLTKAGKARLAEINEGADSLVSDAFRFLSDEERQAVLSGISTYSKALARARALRRFILRPARIEDNAAMAKIIRTVMPEFGAVGPGYSINDPEVSAMFEAYDHPRAGLWVVEREGQVVGCGGFAPLEGAASEVCELKKMYFLAEARGHGVGQRLLETILNGARAAGYKVCYLETLERMHAAKALYARCGFKPLCAPMGQTGHTSCDAWFYLEL